MDYFYKLVNLAYEYNDKEKMEDYYSIKLDQMKWWMEDRLDDYGVPEGSFRRILLEEWFSEDHYSQVIKLYEFIQSMCAPEEEEEEAD